MRMIDKKIVFLASWLLLFVSPCRAWNEDHREVKLPNAERFYDVTYTNDTHSNIRADYKTACEYHLVNGHGECKFHHKCVTGRTLYTPMGIGSVPLGIPGSTNSWTAAEASDRYDKQCPDVQSQVNGAWEKVYADAVTKAKNIAEESDVGTIVEVLQNIPGYKDTTIDKKFSLSPTITAEQAKKALDEAI